MRSRNVAVKGWLENLGGKKEQKKMAEGRKKEEMKFCSKC